MCLFGISKKLLFKDSIKVSLKLVNLFFEEFFKNPSMSLITGSLNSFKIAVKFFKFFNPVATFFLHTWSDILKKLLTTLSTRTRLLFGGTSAVPVSYKKHSKLNESCQLRIISTHLTYNQHQNSNT